jgi:hypothetical protein
MPSDNAEPWGSLARGYLSAVQQAGFHGGDMYYTSENKIFLSIYTVVCSSLGKEFV